MKIIKQFPLIILIAIFLISCRTSTNKEYPINNLEKNIDENPNTEKKRMEINFSCGKDGISEYLDDGWKILKEDSQEKICTWKSVPATKDCNMEKDKGCKVIASFGNISASGGVYIGVASDKIVANPGTITGSIGVIIRGNNLSELLDKIGIKFETVKSGVFKDILSPDKPLSEEGRGLLQGLIDESYRQFTEAVAEGRNLPVEEVRKFADGRIFTGTQAKELGLVDEVGDEFVARELVAKMVNIDPKIEPLTFGKKKKKILGLIPGSRMVEKIINNIFFEFDSSNKVLWLYKP